MANINDKLAEVARQRKDMLEEAEAERARLSLALESRGQSLFTTFDKLDVGALFEFYWRRNFPGPDGPYIKLTKNTYRLAADENAEVKEVGTLTINVERRSVSSDGK